MLKFETKLSTNVHRNLSGDIPSGRVSFWSLNLMCRHKLSNILRDNPVSPKVEAGTYLDGAILDQSEAREPNSNLDDKKHTQKN